MIRRVESKVHSSHSHSFQQHWAAKSQEGYHEASMPGDIAYNRGKLLAHRLYVSAVGHSRGRLSYRKSQLGIMLY